MEINGDRYDNNDGVDERRVKVFLPGSISLKNNLTLVDLSQINTYQK